MPACLPYDIATYFHLCFYHRVSGAYLTTSQQHQNSDFGPVITWWGEREGLYGRTMKISAGVIGKWDVQKATRWGDWGDWQPVLTNQMFSTCLTTLSLFLHQDQAWKELLLAIIGEQSLNDVLAEGLYYIIYGLNRLLKGSFQPHFASQFFFDTSKLIKWFAKFHSQKQIASSQWFKFWKIEQILAPIHL